jgi:TP901 family phage tail tape measure protein
MARVGGSRVFFDVVGVMQTQNMITDARDTSVMIQALFLDAFDGIKGALDGMFEGVDAAIQQILDPALEMGAAQVQFEKFFSFDGADEASQRIIAVGQALGFTGTEALEAGAKMAQLGGVFGSDSAVQAGTEAGMIFGLIGGMETEDAMNRLVSLGQQTQFMYGGLTQAQFDSLDAQEQYNLVLANSIKVLDELNTVEDNSVATMEQISTVMNEFAAGATSANMSISEMAALSGTLVEMGEQTTRAGRGIKQILNRIATDTGGATQALNDFGVATTDVNGDMIGLTRIMDQLVERGWYNLDSTQQRQMATTIAGSQHSERFIKLMTQLDRVHELTALSIDREKSALEELNRVTSSSTFEHNQLTAANETLNAQIGDHFLPTITAADSLSFGLKNTLHDLLVVSEEGEGAFDSWDGLASALTTGAGRSIIMAKSMYDIVGGAFEAFLNVQSLLISIQVYRSILRQTTELQKQNSNAILFGNNALMASNFELAEGVGLKMIGLNQNQQANMMQRVAKSIAKDHNIELNKKNILTQINIDKMNAAKAGLTAELAAERDLVRLQTLKTSMTMAEARNLNTIFTARVNTYNAEVTKLQTTATLRKLNKDEQARLNFLESEGVVAAHAANIANLTTIRQVIEAKGTMATRSREVAGAVFQEATARNAVIKKEQEDFIATLHLLKAKGALTKAEVDTAVAAYAAARGIQTTAQAATLSIGSLARLEGAAWRGAFTMNRLAGAAGLASMAMMFFPENEDAMQASMILMAISMVPAIASMTAYTRSTQAATAATIGYQAVTTVGVMAAAAIVAYAAAMVLMNNTMDELRMSTEDANDTWGQSEEEIRRIMAQFGNYANAGETALDFNFEYTDSLQEATDATKEFADAREELFFGFKPSRMNQALFNDLVNQGVGELYYQTDINMTNNWYGMTTEEMVNEISDQIEEKLQLRIG